MSLVKESITLRKARVEDAERLTKIAMHAKAHWGYSPEFMRAATMELTVLPENISDESCQYYVAIAGDLSIGFYALEKPSMDAIELGAMFVEPGWIGKGVGKIMMRHATSVAMTTGAKKLIIQSDPYAEGFYQAAGGRVTGKRESDSIPGRYLPILEISLV